MFSFPSLTLTLFCFLISFHNSAAFVYTCNEIKYNLVPNNLSISTQFACIVHQSNVKIAFDDEQFDGDNVRDLFLVNDEDGERYNFIDIANSTEHCLTGGPWRVESDAPIEELDFDKEVTLLFSSVLPNIFIPKTLGEDLDSDMFTDEGVTVVSPNGGINFDMFFLGENATGSLDFYSGIGVGEEEEMVLLRKQEYTSEDDVNLYYLGPVATVKMAKPFFFAFIVSGIIGSYEFSYAPVGFEVISSGTASVLQSTQNERIQINYGLGAIVTLTGAVIFDPEVHTSISVSCTDYDNVVWGAIIITNSGDVNWTSQCRFLDFNYTGSLPKEETARRSTEKISLSLTAVDLSSLPEATTESTMETTEPSSEATTAPPKTRRTPPTTSTTMKPSSTTTRMTTVPSSSTTTVGRTTSSHNGVTTTIATIILLITVVLLFC